MDEAKGRWVATCGADGTEWIVRNAGWVTERPDGLPCEHLDDLSEPSVAAELGWCGCGSPEDVDRMMLAYLRNIEARWTVRKDEDAPHWGWRATEGLSTDAETLIQYMADALGWTEHGGTVGGAWLTDDGHVALRNLMARESIHAV